MVKFIRYTTRAVLCRTVLALWLCVRDIRRDNACVEKQFGRILFGAWAGVFTFDCVTKWYEGEKAVLPRCAVLCFVCLLDGWMGQPASQRWHGILGSGTDTNYGVRTGYLCVSFFEQRWE